VIDVSTLQPRRHEPPAGWSADVFERVTDAVAAALVSAVRRERELEERGVPRPEVLVEAAR
jgi:hypothetical protein